MKQTSMIISSKFETIGERICEVCGTKVLIIKFKDKEISDCVICENNNLQLEYQKQFEVAEKNKNIAMFKKHSLIPESTLNARFATYKPDHPSKQNAKSVSIEYTKNFDKIISGEYEYHSLLLQGGFGVGKSHLAYSIAEEIIKMGYFALFIDVPQLLQFFRNNIQSKELDEQAIMNIFSKTDLMIFDDLGAEYIKKEKDKESWAVDKLFSIFNLRNDKPKIITTNYDSKGLKEKYGLLAGGRILSRMMMGTKRVAIEGKDHRINSYN